MFTLTGEVSPEEIARQQHVVDGLSDVVADNLKLLQPIDTRWWPQDFLSFLDGTEEERHEGLRQQREEAEGLSDELLVALIGNTITEDALANYALRLGVTTQSVDRTGVSMNPWMQWSRGWLAEEYLHGVALTRYLEVSGRVNLAAVDRTTFSLIQRGFQQDPSPYIGLAYPMFQEVATRISHERVGRMAQQAGATTLAHLCTQIKADEARHGLAYLNIMKALLDADEAPALIAFARLIDQGVNMPAQNMTDELNPRAPRLYGRFAKVSSRIGVYTGHDYANILERLTRKLGIADRSVSGEAARAQTLLCEKPGEIRTAWEAQEAARNHRDVKPVPFSWLYGRKV